MLVPFLISVVIQMLLVFRFTEGRKTDLVLNTTIGFILILNVIFFLHAFFHIVISSQYIIIAFIVVFMISFFTFLLSRLAKKTN
jgi:hypothetical protein